MQTRTLHVKISDESYKKISNYLDADKERLKNLDNAADEFIQNSRIAKK